MPLRSKSNKSSPPFAAPKSRFCMSAAVRFIPARAEQLKIFAERTGIPVTMTLMGLGAFPGTHDQSLHMLGMHGTEFANYAVADSDLLLAFGVRFDDRVTGKLEEFAKHGKIVHVEIDPSEIHKNKEAHIPVVADVKVFLERLNEEFDKSDIPDTKAWWVQLNEWRHTP